MRRSIKEASLIIVVSAMLGFCYTGLTAKGFFAPVKTATTSQPVAAPEIITFDEAKQAYESGDAIFVDARHGFDFQLGHIKGAVNIPLKDAQESPEILTILPKENMLITYCDGEDCNSSITLAAKLDSLGYKNVRVFFGGWKEWQAGNLPTEKTE
ncbi:MAG: rhodanese-like domain-containing protein [Bacteroidota bacterium]